MCKILKENKTRDTSKSRTKRLIKFIEKSNLKFDSRFSVPESSVYTRSGDKLKLTCKFQKPQYNFMVTGSGFGQVFQPPALSFFVSSTSHRS